MRTAWADRLCRPGQAAAGRMAALNACSDVPPMAACLAHPMSTLVCHPARSCCRPSSLRLTAFHSCGSSGLPLRRWWMRWWRATTPASTSPSTTTPSSCACSQSRACRWAGAPALWCWMGMHLIGGGCGHSRKCWRWPAASHFPTTGFAFGSQHALVLIATPRLQLESLRRSLEAAKRRLSAQSRHMVRTLRGGSGSTPLFKPAAACHCQAIARAL